MLKPTLLEGKEVDRSVRTELRLAGIAARASAVSPWAHDQPLQAFLVLREGDVVHVGRLCAPRVVPASEEIDRNVLVVGDVRDDIIPRVLPEAVVIAVR